MRIVLAFLKPWVITTVIVVPSAHIAPLLLQNSWNSKVTYDVSVLTTVISEEEEPPLCLYCVVNPDWENCWRGTLILIKDPARILSVKVIAHVIWVLESAFVTDRTAVPVQTPGVRVWREVALVAISISSTSLL